MEPRRLIVLLALAFFQCPVGFGGTASVCQRLLALHAQLDMTIRDPEVIKAKPFISGWQTYAGADPKLAQAVLPKIEADDLLGYRFSSDEPRLVQAIQRFHRDRDGKEYQSEQIFPSAGSSNLIAAFLQSLKRQGIRKVYYFPPLYYLFHDQAEMLGIEMVPLTKKPISMMNNLEEILPASLPSEKSYLLLSDPIWMMGVPVPESNIETLRRWQERTGGMIFVDGTFQYIKWEVGSPEFSAHLDPDRTIRLVCPSKQTGIHGVRFAYLLMPDDPTIRSTIRLSSSNLGGGHSAFDRITANRIMDVVSSGENRPFIEEMKRRHDALVKNGVLIEEAGNPSATFFTFARVRDVERYTAMHQEFFGLEDFPDFVRVNLLSDAFYDSK